MNSRLLLVFGSDVGLGSNSQNDHLMEDYEIILRVMNGGVLE